MRDRERLTSRPKLFRSQAQLFIRSKENRAPPRSLPKEEPEGNLLSKLHRAHFQESNRWRVGEGGRLRFLSFSFCFFLTSIFVFFTEEKKQSSLSLSPSLKKSVLSWGVILVRVGCCEIRRKQRKKHKKTTTRVTAKQPRGEKCGCLLLLLLFLRFNNELLVVVVVVVGGTIVEKRRRGGEGGDLASLVGCGAETGRAAGISPPPPERSEVAKNNHGATNLLPPLPPFSSL